MFSGLFSGGIFSSLILLQFGGFPAFREANPMEGIAIIIVIASIVVLTIIFGAVRTKVSSSPARRSAGVKPRRVSYFAIRRVASAYGLDSDQSKYLAGIFRNDAVREPERVMQNPAVLDRVFQNAYRSIERNSRTDEAAQRGLTQLFSLRNAIEASPGPNTGQDNRISSNTPAILMVAKESYPVKVISQDVNAIVTEIPRNSIGTPLRLTRGTNVSLSFFTQSSKGFSLDGRVIDNGNSPGLKIVHSGKSKPLVKRNYRRKQINMDCEFYSVVLEVTGSGRKRTSRLVTGNKQMIGTVLDISAGGCSIKTTTPPSVGSRIKISLEYNRYNINVLGLVLRTNRSAGYGTILHIKFLKVPRKAYNSISAIVFGYDSRY